MVGIAADKLAGIFERHSMYIYNRLAMLAGIFALLFTAGVGSSYAFNANVDWVQSIKHHQEIDLPKKIVPVALPRQKPSPGKNSANIPAKIRGAGGLNPHLAALLHRVASHFRQRVQITSGCRSHAHNRRVGGARKSLHLRCMAADIRVTSVSQSKLKRFLRSLPGHGGIGTYCNKSIVHIDVGRRRSWHYGCKKRRRYAKKRRKLRVASIRRKKARR
jgi:hypothetical protein